MTRDHDYQDREISVGSTIDAHRLKHHLDLQVDQVQSLGLIYTPETHSVINGFNMKMPVMRPLSFTGKIGMTLLQLSPLAFSTTTTGMLNPQPTPPAPTPDDDQWLDLQLIKENHNEMMPTMAHTVINTLAPEQSAWGGRVSGSIEYNQYGLKLKESFNGLIGGPAWGQNNPPDHNETCSKKWVPTRPLQEWKLHGLMPKIKVDIPPAPTYNVHLEGVSSQVMTMGLPLLNTSPTDYLAGPIATNLEEHEAKQAADKPMVKTNNPVTSTTAMTTPAKKIHNNPADPEKCYTDVPQV